MDRYPDLTDLDLFAAGFPHAIFTRLRGEAPVWFHPPTAHTPGGEGFWVLSRYAEIASVAQDATTFSSESGGDREGGGTILEDLPRGFATGVLLNMMDDPRHRHIRRLATPALGVRALAGMEAELRTRCDAIVDAALARGACDFVVDVAAELPLQAIARLLGIPQSDRHRLFGWATAMLDYGDRELGEQSVASQAAAAALHEYGVILIAEKRRHPGDDMLSAVVHGQVVGPTGTPGPLTDLEVAMFFNLLVAAGSETTRNSIALGVHALAADPPAWGLLVARPDLVPTAVEEMLRWASSTPYNRRTATQDVVIGDARIREGDKVSLWWASANRDEHVFVEPFRFDVRRVPNPHLAFGHGAHFCLGAGLARLEMRIVLETLLARVTAVEPAGPLVWTRSNKHTGLKRMPVRLHPRA